MLQTELAKHLEGRKNKQKTPPNPLKCINVLFLEPAYFIDLFYSCIDIDKELKCGPGKEQVIGSGKRWKSLKSTLPQRTYRRGRKPDEMCMP